MLAMLSSPKHLIRAPLYLQQGKRVKQDTLRLPEARPLKKEERRGVFPFVRNRKHQLTKTPNTDNDLRENDLLKSNFTKYKASTDSTSKPCHHLMVVGDSSSAGVGVDYQSQSLIGQLLLSLYHHEGFSQQHSSINWQLHATTGHDSFDVLRRLYLIPATEQPLDLLIVVVGVNDVTKMQSQKTWLNNLNEIITIAQHKFNPNNIVFTGLPPLADFPALPYPLNQFMGDKGKQLDESLQKFCEAFSDVHYASFDLPFDKSNPNNASKYFARDGFHPNGLMYQLWAEHLSMFIAEL